MAARALVTLHKPGHPWPSGGITGHDEITAAHAGEGSAPRGQRCPQDTETPQGWPSPGRGEGVGPGQGCCDHWASWNIVPKGADHELDFDLENNRKGKGGLGGPASRISLTPGAGVCSADFAATRRDNPLGH